MASNRGNEFELQALADIYKPAWYRYAKGCDKKLELGG